MQSAGIPKSGDPATWVRLLPDDRKFAQGLASAMGVPLSTYLRMVILERLRKEREHGK